MAASSSLVLAAALTAGGALGAAQEPRATGAVPPPGLVLVPGGRTKIGIEVADLKRLLEADPKSQGYAGMLSAETPLHERSVQRFFLMVTEVTNEQYADFLRATGRRAPHTWAAKAIAEGRELHLAELEREKQEALAAGRPVPDPIPFDDREWWSSNWSGKPFEVPAGDELRPVVFVDWHDASQYARWAGLRLMTEFEYQRAARGDTTRTYPWGDDWDSEKYALTSLSRKKTGLLPVGSVPAGATKLGVFDLAGGVWEWTSSPYAPYPGYEVRTYRFGSGAKTRQVDAVADWTPGSQVVVGGSFQNGSLMARTTTRRALERDATSAALGFRCAASFAPGLDVASGILGDELTKNARPMEDGALAVFEPEACAAAQRWTFEPSRVLGAPANHARITDHRHVLFVPVKRLPIHDLVGFERLSADRIAQSGAPPCVGFLATNLRIVEPALEAGVYLVYWRPKGDRREGPPNRRPSMDEALGLDPQHDWLVFALLDGTPVRALRSEPVWVSTRGPAARLVDPEAAPRTDVAPEAEHVLRLDLVLETRTRGRGIGLGLPLRLALESLDGVWRFTRDDD